MNLILLEDRDFIEAGKARLTGRRLEHVLGVHRAEVGDKLRVGRVGGLMGEGEILKLSPAALELKVELNQEPPAPLPLTLYLALPRPKFLKRVLQTATTLGVKRIFLFNSYRVEKVYWSCEQITPESIREACVLGLEQARDTILPDIQLRRLFKPFVEDELPSLIRGTRAIVAHPVAATPCPIGLFEQVSLAVGPEGGFIDYEVEKLTQAGFEPVTLYPRILKVETAVATLIGRIMA